VPGAEVTTIISLVCNWQARNRRIVYDSSVRVLIIEDEPKSAAYLRKGLSEHGYVADLAANGEDGLYLAQTSEYDLLILDIMLPRRDGWSVMRELRRCGKQTPVLFLTARDSVPDRVKGLDLGADDYLVKPFAFSELLARIRTVLRRGPVRRNESLSFADLELDPLSHRAIRAGKRLDLTPKEFLLLALFVRRAGEVLSRTMIAEQVWDMNFDCGTNVVDVHVRRLRAKVDDPFGKKLIHTIRGVGYVLEE
jgi:two-component system copper resistance phosphate regulon response regulator CusR